MSLSNVHHIPQVRLFYLPMSFALAAQSYDLSWMDLADSSIVSDCFLKYRIYESAGSYSSRQAFLFFPEY